MDNKNKKERQKEGGKWTVTDWIVIAKKRNLDLVRPLESVTDKESKKRKRKLWRAVKRKRCLLGGNERWKNSKKKSRNKKF